MSSSERQLGLDVIVTHPLGDGVDTAVLTASDEFLVEARAAIADLV
jgi:selenophosphate synthase